MLALKRSHVLRHTEKYAEQNLQEPSCSYETIQTPTHDVRELRRASKIGKNTHTNTHARREAGKHIIHVGIKLEHLLGDSE